MSFALYQTECPQRGLHTQKNVPRSIGAGRNGSAWEHQSNKTYSPFPFLIYQVSPREVSPTSIESLILAINSVPLVPVAMS
jgi:hypothetical protein